MMKAFYSFTRNNISRCIAIITLLVAIQIILQLFGYQVEIAKIKPALLSVNYERWRNYDKLHGHTIEIQSQDCNICDGFFGLWPSDCVDKHDQLDDRLKVLSSQMKLMKSTFTLITTESKMCNFNYYPYIKTLTINSTSILVEYGFTPAFMKMSQWKKTRYTRISDILRICLAHKYKMSYLDTDIHYLNMNKSIYECSYVGAAVWGNSKNALEITNAAFCLPSNILKDMLAFQLNRIIHGDDKFFYTEFGPSMFHNVSLTLVYYTPYIYVCITHYAY